MRSSVHVPTMLSVTLLFALGCGTNEAMPFDPQVANDAGVEVSELAPLGSWNTTPAATPVSTTTQDGQNIMACAQAVVSNPDAKLDGVALFQPAEKQGDPRAGRPSYVYLAAGKEGVILPGPTVTAADGLLITGTSSLSLVGAGQYSADGYHVVVNPSLAYDVAIDDFEYEVTLARVELCPKDGSIESWFIFVGNPGASGVAHAITVGATTTSKVTALQPAVTVEVR